MPTVETLRPTISDQDTTGGGYVLGGPNAFDVNPATYSRAIAENVGEYVTQTLSGFSADSFPNNRSSVVLELDVARYLWTADDIVAIFFRPIPTGAWTLCAIYGFADLGTVLTPKAIDVTAVCGVNPATGFQVAVTFANDLFAGDFPPPGE